MHCATAAEIKTGKRHHSARHIPYEGTAARKAFDVLFAHKGAPVFVSIAPHVRAPLTDVYGLDLRLIRRGDRRVGRKSQWLLAGEWFGKVYVDYVAERLERAA